MDHRHRGMGVCPVGDDGNRRGNGYDEDRDRRESVIEPAVAHGQDVIPELGRLRLSRL
jgi:hypothetical protein